MGSGIKYVHTNLVARDWRKLSQFYINVFGCKPVYPERNLSGEWIEKLTGIEEVRINGIHLSLPGYEDGPTLEIFEYQPENPGEAVPAINSRGFSHLAFHVDSVNEVLDRLLEHGGSKLGDLVVRDYDNLGTLTVVYSYDPEGNFIEIQNWRRL